MIKKAYKTLKMADDEKKNDTSLPLPQISSTQNENPENKESQEITTDQKFRQTIKEHVVSDRFDHIFKGNHCGDFKYALGLPPLNNGEWEVAVASFNIPKGWDNIPEDDFITWYETSPIYDPATGRQSIHYEVVGEEVIKRGRYTVKELIDAVNLATIYIFERNVSCDSTPDYDNIPFLRMEQDYVSLQPGRFKDPAGEPGAKGSLLKVGPHISNIFRCSYGICNRLLKINDKWEVNKELEDRGILHAPSEFNLTYTQLFLSSNLTNRALVKIFVNDLTGKPIIIEDLKWQKMVRYNGIVPEFKITNEYGMQMHNYHKKLSFNLVFRKINSAPDKENLNKN